MFSRAVSIYILIVISIVTSQELTWLNGKDTADQSSDIWGPGGRSGSLSWKDANGYVWLFGGKGFSDLNNGKPILLNDLWRYHIFTNTWSLVHPGSVASMGTSSHSKSPSPRYLGAGCGVTNLTFIIYGGLGENDEALEDTWVYYIKRRTWLLLKGSVDVDTDSDDNHSNITSINTSSNSTSVLNSSYTDPPESFNVYISPGFRGNMASWCLYDSMLVFSGRNNNKTLLNDMWKMSFRNLQWEEIVVKNGTVAPRTGATTWVDRKQVLYMFGGNIVLNSKQIHSTVGYMSDLWMFNETEQTWQLLSGSAKPQTPGQYGRLYGVEYGNKPGSRQGASPFLDSSNNLWLFGGDGLDTEVYGKSELLSDFWRFNTKHVQWSWMGGSKVGEAEVKFSSKGEISSEALIGGRCDATVWLYSGNKFYIFGGLGHDSHKQDGYLNDLWLVDVTHLVYQSVKVKIGTVILFILMAISLVMILAVISLYARDRKNTFSRLNSNIKYSHLATNGD
ncbi:uncharacterized protein LOC126822177 [Patella vulgata]|uniref:uncharacterized protein LOC126822177 n=1 Tax=Patella vulgata TaxID=6465 RepID=UPI00217FE21A|nr:uncharacterized protein LOC126822177 [Patella vulgata]XP_055957312.1 uncharacterized protein LOC126822177 [Patella vulgata]XP_055957313.1 uncharacterized protein LOC126822177 [Patella vulgata]